VDIVSILLSILNILSLILIARALISWVDPMGRWQISRMLYDITEPILAPIRQVLPQMGGIDISTIIAIVLIQILERLIVTSIG